MGEIFRLLGLVTTPSRKVCSRVADAGTRILRTSVHKCRSSYGILDNNCTQITFLLSLDCNRRLMTMMPRSLCFEGDIWTREFDHDGTHQRDPSAMFSDLYVIARISDGMNRTLYQRFVRDQNGKIPCSNSMVQRDDTVESSGLTP